MATTKRVVIGMDPHKRSVTIEVIGTGEEVVGCRPVRPMRPEFKVIRPPTSATRAYLAEAREPPHHRLKDPMGGLVLSCTRRG